jgi:hypothetical protein
LNRAARLEHVVELGIRPPRRRRARRAR